MPERSGVNSVVWAMSNSPPAPAPIGHASPHHPVRGALLFVTGLLLFACMDTTTKYLSAHYEVPLIVAIRYIVNCLLMIVLLAPTHGRQLVETQRTGLVLVRAGCLAAASLLVGLALQRMPVAETTAINFIAPMLVVLIAGPLLGERVGAWGWAAAGAGFAGVLLVARPGSGLETIGIVFALGAVGANAAYQLLSRVLAGSERTIALLFYTALVGSICFGLALPWFWEGRAPGLGELLLFLSLGVYGGVGHFLFTAAYRHAPASMLAPMNYLQLLWAGLLGWLVFGHVPDRLSTLGMCVIAASGLVMALKSRRPVTRPQSRAIADNPGITPAA
jgi:drug/metabolite transporter (DMT)-like permease